MPITTSAKKALRQSARRRVQNVKRQRAYKDAVKSVRTLIGAGKKEEARSLLPKAYKTLDKATKSNVIKKNTASRIKSRLAKSATSST
ncbi:MAG: 30S ribosomal protein S20 [Patescibacteria group bacterium]